MNKLFLIITCLCSSLLVMGQGQIKRHQKEYKNKVEISIPDGYINGHGYVDLGLPSGTKWATCNVGAAEPWNYGDYYSWGETSTKEKYEMTESNLSRKRVDQIVGNVNYDAATRNWGTGWCMPSEIEMEELFKHSNIKAISISNVKGILITGPNGKNIFIPKSGYCDFGRNKPVSVGELLHYWTGTANYKHQGEKYYEDDMYSTALRDNHTGCNDYSLQPSFRGWGMPIRPILSKK